MFWAPCFKSAPRVLGAGYGRGRRQETIRSKPSLGQIARCGCSTPRPGMQPNVSVGHGCRTRLSVERAAHHVLDTAWTTILRYTYAVLSHRARQAWRTAQGHHKATRHKATRHKAMRHKAMRRKATRHRATRHKATRHKATHHKATRRQTRANSASRLGHQWGCEARPRARAPICPKQTRASLSTTCSSR